MTLAINQDVSNAEWIQQKLSHSFPDATLTVQDTRGDDMHLSLCIKSDVFKEKTPLQCHRMIYDSLDNLRCGQIHALSIQASSI